MLKNFNRTAICALGVFAMALSAGCGSQPVNPPLPKARGTAAADDGATPEGFERTKSGLKYKIVRTGNGKKPTADDTVLVNYRGWLDNGKEFDSSYGKKPIDFPLRGVIPGWTEGIQFVEEGGEIELEIPSKLGYGPQGHPPDIPGGATLHFKVELLEIK